MEVIATSEQGFGHSTDSKSSEQLCNSFVQPDSECGVEVLEWWCAPRAKDPFSGYPACGKLERMVALPVPHIPFFVKPSRRVRICTSTCARAHRSAHARAGERAYTAVGE